MYVCMYVCAYVATHILSVTYCSSEVKAYKEGTGRPIFNCNMKTLHYYPPVVHYHQLKQCHCKICMLHNAPYSSDLVLSDLALL